MLDRSVIFRKNTCLGPFVGNTSYPILLIGNTLGR